MGVTRILTIGMDAESRRKALQAAETYDEVYAAIGHHPNEATGYTDAITAELRELAQHPKCLAIGETGLDDFRDYAPRQDQERAFDAQIELAHELEKPLIIHTRAAEDDTLDLADDQGTGPRGDHALLLDARRAWTSAWSTAGGSRSPATSPIRRRRTWPKRRPGPRSTACSWRPTPRT